MGANSVRLVGRWGRAGDVRYLIVHRRLFSFRTQQHDSSPSFAPIDKEQTLRRSSINFYTGICGRLRKFKLPYHGQQAHREARFGQGNHRRPYEADR